MKKAKRPSKASRKLKPQHRDNEEFMENFQLDSDDDLLLKKDEKSDVSCLYEKSIDQSEEEEEDLETQVKSKEKFQKEIKHENDLLPDVNSNWEKIEYVYRPKFVQIERKPSTSISKENLRDPYGVFSQFFDDDFFAQLAEQTNIYAAQQKTSNEDYCKMYPRSRMNRYNYFTIEDIREYVAIILLMGVHSLPSQRDYWSKDFYFMNPISKVMSSNKYQAIHSAFHLSDNSKKSEGKIHKAKLLLGLIDKFSQLYSPSDKLVIDEGVVPFKGRLNIKQYMPYKPHKWGIKAYIIADSMTGYNLKTVFYTGKDTFSDEKSKYIGYNVVDKLMEPYFNNGYQLYIDSFYTSYDLVKDMHANGVGITGTFFSNRRGFPKFEKKSPNLKKHEFVTYRDGELLCSYWMDTVMVSVVSNVHSNETLSKRKKIKNGFGNPYTKPNMIEKYSLYMKGVDLHNQMCSYYKFPHRSLKWWRVLFYHSIQMTIVNSYLIYREFSQDNKKFDHKMFILEIVESILRLRSKFLKEIPSSPPVVSSSSSQHYIVKAEKKKQRCIICKKITSFMCRECSAMSSCLIMLCLEDCYENFHVNKN